MQYKIRLCKINNDWTVEEGKRTERITWPCALTVGGLYNLRPGRFYRIIEQIKEK